MIMNKINNFRAVLGSDKFNKDLKESRELLNDLHTLRELREDFAWFITAYPLSSGKKKAMCKLDGKKKFGIVSRHLMGVSKRLGVSDLYLTQYHELKDDEKRATKDLKEESWKYYWTGGGLKPSESAKDIIGLAQSEVKDVARRGLMSRQLFSQTYNMLDLCLSKYDAREDKINQILEDE